MLKSKNINDILVLSFADTNRFNSLIAGPVKEKLLEYYEKPNVKIILNLEGIQFIDSSGFGVFLSALKAANSNSGRFKICSVNKEVMELFKLLQLHNVFEIYRDLDECLKSFE
ncbi:MAG: STAS domain-containing protein [Bacteroidales bacterium]|nr:STAS domain-containing protein [Bacteroidales bacterium]MBN2697228.1 STAS domain-containing protein [Bacteroidales bacterium]